MHVYIDVRIQILIYECTGYGVQDISILKHQCENMTFTDQSRYNIMFQKVVHKEGKSEINYMKIFKNAKALAVSVVNSYSGYQLMHAFLGNY